MAKNYEVYFPFTPTWSGNRSLEAEEQFSVLIKDMSLSEMERMVEMVSGIKDDDTAASIRITKDMFKLTGAKFQNFTYDSQVIESVEDFIAKGGPVSLMQEVVDRWRNGRPSEEELKN